MRQYGIGVVLLALIVGLAVGAGLYDVFVFQPYKQSAEANQAALQSQIQQLQQEAATVTAADINIVASSTLLNFSTAVASDGSVAADTNQTIDITIENTETDVDVKDFTISLQSADGTGGLPAALENSYFEVYLVVGSTQIPLFKNGEYFSGYVIPSLPAGSSTTVTLKVVMKQAPAGVFADGQSYTVKLYFRQPYANNYEDKLTLTLTT